MKRSVSSATIFPRRTGYNLSRLVLPYRKAVNFLQKTVVKFTTVYFFLFAAFPKETGKSFPSAPEHPLLRPSGLTGKTTLFYLSVSDQCDSSFGTVEFAAFSFFSRRRP